MRVKRRTLNFINVNYSNVVSMKIASAIKLLLLMTLLFTAACIRQNKITQVVQNKRLLNSRSKFTYGADSVERLDSNVYNGITAQSLNKKTDTIIYRNNEIYISCLKITNGCSEYVGDIQFDKDTLKLIVINTSDRVCSESNIWRITYRIANSLNKRYIIKKE